jgi:peptidoglycan/LPS O-acetylase OafA/YrhL
MVFGATVIALYLLLMNGRTMLGFGPDDAHGDAGSNLFDLTVSVALVLLLIERRAAGTRSSLSRFLGDISYPLYLLHWPVLCLLLAGSVRLLGAGWIAVHVELWTVSLFALSAPLLILLAWSCYRWLERPAIAAGKRLADRLSRRSPIETKEGFSGYGVVAVTNAETGHV